MLNLTIKEATSLLNIYGVDCHWHQVKKWAVEGKIKAIHEDRVYRIEEKELHKFIESYRWDEHEIDDKAKITRLQEEIQLLRKSVDYLEKENMNLRIQLTSLEEVHF